MAIGPVVTRGYGLTGLPSSIGNVVLRGYTQTDEIFRRGGRFIFDREPDPEIREEKVAELVTLLKPKPKPTARTPQEPREPLSRSVLAATAQMSRRKQARVDRLLQEAGISMDELLILLQ